MSYCLFWNCMFLFVSEDTKRKDIFYAVTSIYWTLTSAPLRSSSVRSRSCPKCLSWSHFIGAAIVQWGAAICAGLVAVRILMLRFIQGLLALIIRILNRYGLEITIMKLTAAFFAVFASIALTSDATVHFKEQFLDGGTVLPIPCLVLRLSDCVV